MENEASKGASNYATKTNLETTIIQTLEDKQFLTVVPGSIGLCASNEAYDDTILTEKTVIISPTAPKILVNVEV